MDQRVPVLILVVLLAGCPGGAGEPTGQPDRTATDIATATPTPTDTSTPASAATARPNDTDHGLDESFVVGRGSSRLRYVVTGVERTDRIGGEFGVAADEEFLVVSLAVTNLGGNVTRLTGDLFTLVDDEDRTVQTDGQAMLVADDALTVRSLGPDATVEGVIVFDVPPDRRGLTLRVDPANDTSTADAHHVALSAGA